MHHRQILRLSVPIVRRRRSRCAPEHGCGCVQAYSTNPRLTPGHADAAKAGELDFKIGATPLASDLQARPP